MPDDINNLDTREEGLQGIFGDRFQDMTVAKSCTARKAKATKDTTQPQKKAQKDKDKPMDASYEAMEPAPYFIDKLKSCAKRVGIFAGLNLLIYYWQLEGLMAPSVALPSMLVCAAMAGFGFAKLLVEGDC